jgi:hypothetical protein
MFMLLCAAARPAPSMWERPNRLSAKHGIVRVEKQARRVTFYLISEIGTAPDQQVDKS